MIIEGWPTYEQSIAIIFGTAPILGMITTSRGCIVRLAAQREQESKIMAWWHFIVYWAPFVAFSCTLTTVLMFA
jgi:hypothetical protein